MTWTPEQRRKWLKTNNAKKYYQKWQADNWERNKAIDAAWRRRNKKRIKGYYHKKMALRGNEARRIRRAWYRRNRNRIRINENMLYQEKRKFLNELKKRPCVDCRRKFPPVCMDFDHCRGRKSFSIGKALHSSLKRLIKEIEKCDLVCACCHRIRTARRNRSHRGLWKAA